MMNAVGFYRSLPIDNEDSFLDVTCEKPTVAAGELLVKIKAIAVNPVDYKVRQNSAKDVTLRIPKIIGWDAVGVIEEIGEGVNLFNVGDEVFYAGNINKQGCYAAYQAVDERIVGAKPKTLSDAEAAAMPLTSITAWEMLFDRIRIDAERDKGKSILIIGGAGGVGSIAIQLAKKVAQLQVIATASRPESEAWCRKQGADVVVQPQNLVENVSKSGFEQVDYIIDLVNTNHYWDAMVELIRPQGHIASITGSDTPVALNKLKTKSVSFSWEYMYTRPLYNTPDIIRQHEILQTIANLIDDGILCSTLGTTMQGLNANNIKAAHRQLEQGSTIGKIAIVLE